VETVEGLSGIALQHLYRTNGFLAEVRAELERALFLRDRDLFCRELDLVFLDTTSVYVYRDTETEWRKRGYSRDHRPDLPQVVLGVAVDRRGWPVSWDVFPGHTADPAVREAILARLEEKLSGGAKSLLGNKGYARFLKMAKGSLKINEEAVAAEARYDGKFVLRTNTDLEAAEVAQTYKSLWRVERTFRETKSTLEVRPIFHHNDETTIGHIVAGFLALRLEVDLQRRLDERGVEASWPTLMRNPAQVQAVRVELGGKTYLLRTDLQGSAHQAFQAAGMRPPSPVTMMA
jgi:transposase